MQGRKNVNMVNNGFFVQIEMSNQQPFQMQFLIADCDSNKIYELKIKKEDFQLKFRGGVFKTLLDLYCFFEKHHKNMDKIMVQKQGKIIIYLDKEMSYDSIQDTFILQAHQITASSDMRSNNCQQNNKDIKERITNYIIGNGNKIVSVSNGKSRQQIICQKATDLLRMGIDAGALAKHLKISENACYKMSEQFKKFGKIYPPKKGNTIKKQQAIALSPVTPNMKMQGPHVQKIRNILYQLVQEGKMTTLEEMQQHLSQFNVWRSLSSIYRYVANIKAQNKQFKTRTYAMHRKDNNNLMASNIKERHYKSKKQ